MKIAVVLALAALPLLPAAADAQTDLAFAVRDSLQLDPRGSPQALRLERQRLLDFQLAQLVNQRLAELRGLDGLVVACHQGLVELRGRSEDVEQKERATELALTVTGVIAVNNELLLPGDAVPAIAATQAAEAARAKAAATAPAGPTPTGPETIDLARMPPAPPAAEGWTEPFGFATHDGLAGRFLRVIESDGIVRVRGEVNSERARNYVAIAAQSVEGVRSVRDELVALPMSVEESRRLAVVVQRQLEMDPLVQSVAPLVLVQVVDGIVRLEGRVLDDSQRLRAQDLAAWQTGVFAVDNRLQIDEDARVQATRRGTLTFTRMR